MFFTYDHINKLMIIAKGEEPHIKQSNKQNGKLESKIFLSCNHIYFHIQLYIHHPSMLWPSKQYTKTRRDSSRYV